MKELLKLLQTQFIFAHFASCIWQRKLYYSAWYNYVSYFSMLALFILYCILEAFHGVSLIQKSHWARASSWKMFNSLLTVAYLTYFYKRLVGYRGFVYNHGKALQNMLMLWQAISNNWSFNRKWVNHCCYQRFISLLGNHHAKDFCLGDSGLANRKGLLSSDNFCQEEEWKRYIITLLFIKLPCSI